MEAVHERDKLEQLWSSYHFLKQPLTTLGCCQPEEDESSGRSGLPDTLYISKVSLRFFYDIPLLYLVGVVTSA